MPYVSELAFSDIGLNKWSPEKETSQDSQRVLYEGHVPAERIILVPYGTSITVPWGYTESSLELTPDCLASTSHSSTFIQPDPLPEPFPEEMQGITKDFGEGGAVQRSFIRELRATYHRMLRTPLEQRLNGFGEWEFISLLGEVLCGEAKDVLASFLDKWDFENEE